MSWTFNGDIVENIPDKYIAFVYLIVNKTNNKKYFGKKLVKFTKTSTKNVTLKSGVKKKKKVKVLFDSDWRTYWSSSEDVKKEVEELGEDNFTREILYFCETKGEASYIEAKLQMVNEVLEFPDKYYNRQVSCRVHHTHIKRLQK